MELIVRKRPGRPKKIKKEQAQELVKLIEKPEQTGRTFWTAKAFHGYITEAYQIECSYKTVLRFFHEEGFALKVPQPWPDRQNEEQRDEFRLKLKQLCEDTDVDIWYADESGFEGESKPRRRWDKKGSKSRVVHNGDHIRMNLVGTVCPRMGEFFAIEASNVDSDMFQLFLDETNKCITPQRKRNVIIVDNATWHKKKSLNWHFFEPVSDVPLRKPYICMILKDIFKMPSGYIQYPSKSTA
ncbi:MAG: IS630 family transposase [Nitrospirae bacterium]|nr:IS630 family transposase [Nitrospirota bacterium]